MDHLLKSLARKSHVIWDWNGTILDDVDICVQIMSEIAVQLGVPPITRAEHLKRFKFPVDEYYRDIGFGQDTIPHRELKKKFIGQYLIKAHELRLFPGAADLLIRLHELGIKNSILSAAHEEDVKFQLERFKINHLFTHVFGLENHDAHGKLIRGHELIKRIGTPSSQIALVGDTLHDLEVGRALNIEVILVSGGHQDSSTLANQPDATFYQRHQ